MVIIKNTTLLIVIFTIFVGCSAKRTTPFNNSKVSQIDKSLINVNYTDIGDVFSISRFVIDDEYTISDKNNKDMATYTKEDIEQILYTSTLIGYDSSNLYVLHNEEEYLLVSRINFVSKHIEKNIYKCESKIIFSSCIINGFLYLGEAELVNNSLVSTLKRISLQDNEDKLYEEIIFKNGFPKFPVVSYSDDYVVINYSTSDKYILGYIHHNDDKIIEIFSSDFKVSNGNLYTGEIPLYGNGDKDGIYFQVISLENETIDFEGNQTLYYYSFAEDRYMPKLVLSDKTTYINGNMEIAILNDYAVDSPRTITGKIISFVDNTVTAIPKTRPSNSVEISAINGNYIMVSSSENIYIFDRKKQTFASMDISSINKTEIKIFGDTFGYIDKAEGKAVFYLIRYSKD